MHHVVYICTEHNFLIETGPCVCLLLGRAEASPTQVIPIEIFHLYVYIIYISAVRPSVPYIAAFYFNDIQYFIPTLCACIIRYAYIYEAIAQGSSELIQQLKNERAKKEERLRKTSKERSQKNTCGDTRTERQDYREKRDGVQARPPRSRQS